MFCVTSGNIGCPTLDEKECLADLGWGCLVTSLAPQDSSILVKGEVVQLAWRLHRRLGLSFVWMLSTDAMTHRRKKPLTGPKVYYRNNGIYRIQSSSLCSCHPRYRPLTKSSISE